MAIRALSQTQCEQVDVMRSTNPDKVIAEELNVSLPTLRKNCGTRREWKQRKAQQREDLNLPFRSWDPRWKADVVAERTGVEKGTASRIVAAAARSQRQGHTYLHAFLCRWVERSDDPNAPEPWVTLLAGLPVLAAAMRSPECNLIHTLILQYKPYEAGAKLTSREATTARGYRYKDDPLIAEHAEAVSAYQEVEDAFVGAVRKPVSALRSSIDELSYVGLLELPDSDDVPYTALMRIADWINIAKGIVDPLAGISEDLDPESPSELFRLFAQVLVRKSLTEWRQK